MATLDALGQKIRTLRTDRGLSQQQLADLMFVTRKTISNWESGSRMPDVAMLSRLAKALHVKPHELLDVISSPDAPPVIIIVENEPVILKDFVCTLSDTLPNVQTFGFQNGSEALDYAENNHVDVAFLDTELSGESGITLAEQLLAVNPRTNIIFLAGHTEYTADALRLHCSGYILKPLTPDKIQVEIEYLRFPVQGLNP
jgi:transcriptional regulator with XRE-family HTH domain